MAEWNRGRFRCSRANKSADVWCLVYLIVSLKEGDVLKCFFVFFAYIRTSAHHQILLFSAFQFRGPYHLFSCFSSFEALRFSFHCLQGAFISSKGHGEKVKWLSGKKMDLGGCLLQFIILSLEHPAIFLYMGLEGWLCTTARSMYGGLN